jgi:predicted  nucleic acid-binding Zn-ribbon protein
MRPEIEKLIRLQDVDLEIRRYQNRIELLPRELAVLEEKLRATLQTQDNHKDLGGKLASEKRKGELAIQDVEQKISKYKSQLFDVKTNEQYRALLNEIEFGSQEIRKIEDEILVKMEQEETLKAQGKALEIQLQREKAVVETEKKSAREEVEKDKALLAELDAERERLVRDIPADLLARYHRIAGSRKGIALARAVQETCQACNVRIRPQVFSELIKGDVIHSCDSCNRILYYKAEAPYEVSEV